jgi:hypothetical protein
VDVLTSLRNIALITESAADVIPLPDPDLSPLKLNKAIGRLRHDLFNFNQGTTHEPALYFLHMLYLISAAPTEQIADASFQATVLKTLQEMIYLYRYHVPTSQEIVEFAQQLNGTIDKVTLARSKSKTSTYPNFLFTQAPSLTKHLKSFGLTSPTDTTHPEDPLRKKALEIQADALSNIGICMDPFCLLTALDNTSKDAYQKAYADIFNSVTELVGKTNKLTWVCFASDSLGMSVLRINVLLNLIKTMNPCPAIEFVLIDKRYTKAIHALKNSSEINLESMHEHIMNQVTLGALKQFFQFVSAKAPTNTAVTVCVCNSAESYMNYCQRNNNLNLGSCFLQCDDIWEDHASHSGHSSDGAVKDLEALKKYLSQHAINGKYVLISKDDKKSEAKVKMGDFADLKSEAQATLTSSTYNYLK